MRTHRAAARVVCQGCNQSFGLTATTDAEHGSLPWLVLVDFDGVLDRDSAIQAAICQLCLSLPYSGKAEHGLVEKLKELGVQDQVPAIPSRVAGRAPTAVSMTALPMKRRESVVMTGIATSIPAQPSCSHGATKAIPAQRRSGSGQMNALPAQRRRSPSSLHGPVIVQSARREEVPPVRSRGGLTATMADAFVSTLDNVASRKGSGTVGQARVARAKLEAGEMAFALGVRHELVEPARTARAIQDQKEAARKRVRFNQSVSALTVLVTALKKTRKQLPLSSSDPDILTLSGIAHLANDARRNDADQRHVSELLVLAGAAPGWFCGRFLRRLTECCVDAQIVPSAHREVLDVLELMDVSRESLTRMIGWYALEEPVEDDGGDEPSVIEYLLEDESDQTPVEFDEDDYKVQEPLSPLPDESASFDPSEWPTDYDGLWDRFMMLVRESDTHEEALEGRHRAELDALAQMIEGIEAAEAAALNETQTESATEATEPQDELHV